MPQSKFSMWLLSDRLTYNKTIPFTEMDSDTEAGHESAEPVR